MRRIIFVLWVLAGCSQGAVTPQPELAQSDRTATGTAAPTRSPTASPTASPTPAGTPTITAIPPTILRSSESPQPVATSAVRPPSTPSPVPRNTQPPGLPTQPPATPELAELAYVFPVQPADRAQYGPCHHDYPASDIFAPIGSQFVAVTSGVVDWVTRKDVWDPTINDPPTRGGLSVAMIGDDGVRYYGSHLVEVAEGIEPGVRVEAGQLLGLTGKSGDAINTPPHLHFGISPPTTASDWEVRRGKINPYPYLNAWRNGERRPPDLNVVGGGAC